MKQKTFLIVLCIVIAICILATVAMFIYTKEAYQTTSIISFIAGELW